MSCTGVGPPIREAAIFSAISSCDNLRLGIWLGLGLGSVVWLWQYQELFPATTKNDGFQNGGPFGMADRNPCTTQRNDSQALNSVPLIQL